jgi:hypothetical protein
MSINTGTEHIRPVLLSRRGLERPGVEGKVDLETAEYQPN